MRVSLSACEPPPHRSHSPFLASRLVDRLVDRLADRLAAWWPPGGTSTAPAPAPAPARSRRLQAAPGGKPSPRPPSPPQGEGRGIWGHSGPMWCRGWWGWSGWRPGWWCLGPTLPTTSPLSSPQALHVVAREPVLGVLVGVAGRSPVAPR